MDIKDRLLASACSDTCLMATAAKEIVRLRKIEAAARKVIESPLWVGYVLDSDEHSLKKALEGEE